MSQFDPISLAIVLALMTLVPIVIVVSTSFLKIAVVMSLVRNALGVQQIPPNIALYGMALILTAYVMAPVGMRIQDSVMASGGMTNSVAKGRGASVNMGLSVDALAHGLKAGAEPMRTFLERNSRYEHRDFFVRTAKRLWGEREAADVKPNDFIVLVPAFVMSELTAAFQVGFLLYLPFVVIDLIVSNILLAMGMMMVSPVTISLPLKLFLFVMVDGWTRLIEGLVLSYT